MLPDDGDEDDYGMRLLGCLLVALVSLAFWVGVAWLSF